MARGTLVDKDDAKKAKAYCLRLLKYRQKSEQEIRRKLEEKGFSAVVVEETAAFLRKSGFVDDKLFARLWVQSRMRRPLGRLRLRAELKEKGIRPEWIEEALVQGLEDYDEKETIRQLVRQKLDKMKGLEDEKKKTRLYGYLVRRGFPQGLVIEAILQEVSE